MKNLQAREGADFEGSSRDATGTYENRQQPMLNEPGVPSVVPAPRRPRYTTA